MTASKDQQHPQYSKDRALVNQLLAAEATDFNLVELARLKMRYQGFPGARDIQTDLDKVMTAWSLTEEQLFEKSRNIHQTQQIYQAIRTKKCEDWS